MVAACCKPRRVPGNFVALVKRQIAMPAERPGLGEVVEGQRSLPGAGCPFACGLTQSNHRPETAGKTVEKLVENVWRDSQVEVR